MRCLLLLMALLPLEGDSGIDWLLDETGNISEADPENAGRDGRAQDGAYSRQGDVAHGAAGMEGKGDIHN